MFAERISKFDRFRARPIAPSTHRILQRETNIMVLISDISPGPSYFLMMHTPWNDFDPTCVDRNFTLYVCVALLTHGILNLMPSPRSAQRTTAPSRLKRRTSTPAKPKSSVKQGRSQSLQGPSDQLPAAAAATAALKVHPLPPIPSASLPDDNDTAPPSKKQIPMLLRSMSEMHVTECPKKAYEQPTLPELLGGALTDILSDPKISKFLVPKLESCLPYRFRHKNWRLAYSLGQHGASLHTMFRRVRAAEATLVIVETDDGDIFGGFATEPWSSSGLYFGTGESFVFTCAGKFELFPWTRKNHMIMFSNEDTIAMGGGGGFAWALNHDMSHGTSARSLTFDNRCLARRGDFGIVNFEVWEFACKYQ
ncbi:Aste57867_14396 [Aphanomyces stellatus]|uniref:Oxidation resistance protein 1 n=1 Tax=Aphanomyces stellatus TaxID=120398 RepID=A0A485L1D5_9STRA|nr:hypothetical protein As57867_014342 [Aphanomyces stellatus]VFT91218.1 Aste57867_14396 [Aphanomyces stellatus]